MDAYEISYLHNSYISPDVYNGVLFICLGLIQILNFVLLFYFFVFSFERRAFVIKVVS